MKICLKCRIEKEFSCFGKDRHSKDGLNKICKQCCSDYRKHKYTKEPKTVAKEGMKICPKCNIEKDYSCFYKDKTAKDGVCCWCKNCKSENQKKRKKIKVFIEDGTKFCTKCKTFKKISCFGKDKSRKDGLYCFCLECRKVESRKNYLLPQAKLKKKNYVIKNKERITKNNKEYLKTDKGKLSNLKSRLKKEMKNKCLPYCWNFKDIYNCLKFWNYSCANCKAKFNNTYNKKCEWDHHIAINSKRDICPGTIPTNMICLCHDCNLAKSNKNPEEFYSSETLLEIQNYFKTLQGEYLDYKKELQQKYDELLSTIKKT